MFYWEERQDKIEEILRFSQTIERNKGFFYKDVDNISQYVYENCTMGCYDDEKGFIHGFILLDWIDHGVALLHVCTFSNEFDWVKAWNSQIESKVKKLANQLHVVISYDMTPILILAKRIGFKFKKVGNNYKGLKDL